MTTEIAPLDGAYAAEPDAGLGTLATSRGNLPLDAARRARPEHRHEGFRKNYSSESPQLLSRRLLRSEDALPAFEAHDNSRARWR